MVTIFIARFIIVFCFNFFMISYQMNGINRLVYGVPITIFETSINMLAIKEDEGVTFNKALLENKLTSYFDYSMHNYVDDYELVFYYYNPEDYSYCTSNSCPAVEVTLRTNLMLNFHYRKTLFYEIRSN